MKILVGEEDWVPLNPGTGGGIRLTTSDLSDRMAISYFRNSFQNVFYGKVFFTSPDSLGIQKQVPTGWLSSILDEISNIAVSAKGISAVTVKQETHFIQGAPWDMVLTLKATIAEEASRTVTIESTISNEKEQILAKGSIVFGKVEIG